jgi:membrane associated rhomboid family serine protease
MIGDIAVFFIILIRIVLILLADSVIFPLPVSDTGTVRYRTLPYMTFALIIVNALVFILFLAVGSESETPEGYYNNYLVRTWTYGYREAYVTGTGGSIGGFVVFTSMFMHADFFHLLGNMFFLWTFGRRIEDACGPYRYLLFYLLAGVIATFTFAALNPSQEDVPLVGASGAISGLMGAYLLLFPGAKVNVLWMTGTIIRVPLALLGIMGKNVPIWKWTVQLRAWILLGVYIALQIAPSLATIIEGNVEGGVATLAHLAGIISALLVFLYVRKDLLTRYLSGRRL